jgi:hypothetical protein
MKIRILVLSDMELLIRLRKMTTNPLGLIITQEETLAPLCRERRHPDKEQEEMLDRDSEKKESAIMAHRSVPSMDSTDLKQTKCQEVFPNSISVAIDLNLFHQRRACLKKGLPSAPQ